MPSLLLLLFLLSSIPAVSAIKDTKFVTSGRFFCRATGGGPLNIEISVIEEDYLTSDEVLHTEYLSLEYVFSGTSPMAYNFTASADHDGWIFDKTFEIRLRIVHNCNSRDFFRDPMVLMSDVMKIPVDGETHYITVADIDLTNEGDKIPIPTN